MNIDIDKLLNDIGMSESILFNMDIDIYVSDLESNKLLYVNKSLSNNFSGSTLIGKCCWEAFKLSEKRCPRCPIPYLLKNKGKTHKEVIYKEETDKTYLVNNCFIPWPGGKIAHLSYSMEITDVNC